MLMVSAIAANAADNARIATGRTTAQVRMPSMPVSPMNAVGNITADKENTQPTPQPQPGPQPEPGPTPECPDGGARDSDYTVANCMNDVLSCVNNGALAGGLNDLFNEDMRNAIMNGMGLC